MPVVLRMCDRIKLKVGDVTFTLAPLSGIHKQEILSLMAMKSGEVIQNHDKAQRIYLKHAVKKIEGVQCYDQSDYELSFDNDSLTDDCVDELMYLSENEKLIASAWATLHQLAKQDGLEDGHPHKLPEGVQLDVVPGKVETG